MLQIKTRKRLLLRYYKCPNTKQDPKQKLVAGVPLLRVSHSLHAVRHTPPSFAKTWLGISSQISGNTSARRVFTFVRLPEVLLILGYLTAFSTNPVLASGWPQDDRSLPRNALENDWNGLIDIGTGWWKTGGVLFGVSSCAVEKADTGRGMRVYRTPPEKMAQGLYRTKSEVQGGFFNGMGMFLGN